MTDPARLEVRGARKSFGATAALAGVDLVARRGTIHAVLGENGAGKSTLMRVLVGATTLDQGDMRLDGAAYGPGDPRAAHRAGVAMVHQERLLCPHLTVADNVLLGVEPTRSGILARGRARAETARLLGELGASIAPDARVSDLSPGEQQLVEIARALALPSLRVLVLDEPTSSLAGPDAERLHAVLARLRDRGVTILYVSHFLEEVRAVADAYTVLRDGATVEAGPMAGASVADLVRAMVGRPVERSARAERGAAGEVALELTSLAGVPLPVDASLALRRGEILGLAGLVGAGRTELVRTIFGLAPVKSGRIRVGAYVGPASPAARLAQGVGLLSEDRKGEGLVLSMSIADNVTLPRLSGFGPAGTVLASRQGAAARRWIDALTIKCAGPAQAVRDLSGGNQQKVALARLLQLDVDVLLLDEPTRGIDVKSRAQIHGLVADLAARGKAVLLVSSHLPELFEICDRIAVMRRGRLGAARPIGETDEHAVLSEAVQ